jgi:SAM-dependent methyltransferase
MSVEYDKYYQVENLFGNPYPELMKFYSNLEKKGRLLDLGCGQGRDSIPLARLGFEVVGIDNSEVGITQLNKRSKEEGLSAKGIVGDIYEYPSFDEFEFILLDSMFHFAKKDREKESNLLRRIFEESNLHTLITICIQDTGEKVEILNRIISESNNLEIVGRTELVYKFEDKESNHSSETKYEMVTIKKV